MKNNPLVRLQQFGQSIWLDFIERRIIHDGQLQRFIDEDGLRGVTSNPAIFEKAIDGSDDYDDAIRKLADAGADILAIYEDLTVTDVGDAADLFLPVYEKSEAVDGYVSYEVSPKLAHDTAGTIAEAHRIWNKLARPNVMIKVPATAAGLGAIEQLISDGINVNVTLLFGLGRYEEVTNAYISGLKKRAAAGKPIDRIASVASFFLSRIDVMLDPILEQKGKPELCGTIAIASARGAYEIYQRQFGPSGPFAELAKKGARPQRLLWASTSTKNPNYNDIMYVEALIGPDTVNTVPMETLAAYRDHGQPADRLVAGIPQAKQELASLSAIGIDINQVTQALIDEGVDKFIKPFDKLLGALEAKRKLVTAK